MVRDMEPTEMFWTGHSCEKEFKWISLNAAVCIAAGCGVTPHLLLFLAVADLITQWDQCLR